MESNHQPEGGLAFETSCITRYAIFHVWCPWRDSNPHLPSSYGVRFRKPRRYKGFVGTRDRTRTDTVQILSLMPPTFGLHGHYIQDQLFAVTRLYHLPTPRQK
jgi:hypothetical protein